MIQNMDQTSLPIVISCLCTTSAEHKVFARKECARALGIVASESCPLRHQALQPPHLAKVLGQLRKSLQDTDSGVREASAEALALVARGLAELGPGFGNGSATNPVLKMLFDCIAEQKKELNAAACAALGMAAPAIGTLDTALARELLRKLNAPSFQAPAPLLAALARTDPSNGEPTGLLKAGMRSGGAHSGPGAFLPLMSSLVGQQPQGPPGSATSGSGAVGALYRTEWPVRLAAADMLRATAMLLGPLMEPDGCWQEADQRCLTGRALRGLESCRFDKSIEDHETVPCAAQVRDVRDVARAALAVLEELHSYGGEGGSLTGWPAHIAERLQARGLPGPAPSPEPAAPGRKSPLRRASPESGPAIAARRRASPSPERRSSPLALARDSSMAERFRAAHRSGDIAVHDPLGRVEFTEEVVAVEAVATPGPDARSKEAGRDGISREGEASEAPQAGAQAPPVLSQANGVAAGGDDDLPLTWDGSDGPPTFARQLSEASRAAVSTQDVVDGLPSATGLAAPPGPTVTVPTEEWLAAQQRLQSLEAQQRELLEAFSSLSEHSKQAISGLQQLQAEPSSQQHSSRQLPRHEQPDREDAGPVTTQQGLDRAALMRTIRPGTPLSLALGGSGDAAELSSPRVSVQLPPTTPSYTGSQDSGGASLSGGHFDVRQAYCEALAAGRAGDMHLLRLMQRTGPVWNELGYDVSCQLLVAYTAILQHSRGDGPLLLRILPWLWRLADDENNRFISPHEMRGPLLAALRAALPSVADATRVLPSTAK
ncbi:hypothetical protein GPECTOR_1g763 [Gonium pectorale]|uniref:TOG domain-containing protein n=1 Tax=Gonium pectorale TaxID=33097 RepID=A0A150H3Z5_GONPE|nr:hypothetical protein GPECTOR_1g763 [Gonium pectorale]|eukprot:KXZ56846.1 hypothetical protein GPECTOR_1g763 [Gonium pectorale]